MKFTAKLADGDVNVSASHPLKELAWLVGGFITFLVLFYIFLGFVSSVLAMRLPVKAEAWMGSKIALIYEGQTNTFLQTHLDGLVSALPDDSVLNAYTFRIILDDEEDQVNAFALPGGLIVVYAGLLENVQSENELDMILAHELGHFAHRDHLQAMGRSLIVAFGSWLLSGDGSSDVVTWIASKLERKYSQKQEIAADAWGLDLLNRRYGHVGGATDFFKRLATDKKDRLAYFLATHPHPGDRVQYLNTLIEQNGYDVRDSIPLPEGIVEEMEE
jgi:predicted Zn-dependent protease